MGDNTGLTTKDTLGRILMTGIMAEVYDTLYANRWLFITALIIVLVDLWFGISESKAKGERVRWSKAGRRTINKSIDYICYIAIGIILGKALGEPLGLEPEHVSVVVMLFCCGFEVDSIWSHICYLHGIKKPLSVWKILFLLFAFRFREIKKELYEIGDILEEASISEKKEKAKEEQETNIE